MASTTLHDPPASAAPPPADFLLPRPRVSVRLPAAESEALQRSRSAARSRAWDTAAQMIRAVLDRAAGETEAAAPTRKAGAAERGYAADAVCQAVRTLVELDDAAHTFEVLNESFKAYTARIVGHLESVCAGDIVGDMTLTRLTNAWDHYRCAFAEISEVWVFLDRWYVLRFTTTKSIERLAVAILRDALLQHDWLLQRSQEGYLRAFHRDLEVMGSGRQELRLFTDLCVAVQVYYLHAEPKLISVATDFYTARSESMWADGTPSERFFTRVEVYLNESRRRVEECFEAGSLAKFEANAQNSLLLKHGVSFLERDFARLTQEGRYDTFSLAWRLLAAGKFVRLGKQCGSVFRQYVAREGAAIMRQLSAPNDDPITSNSNNNNKDANFVAVRGMIALMYRGEEVIQKGFEDDSMAFSVQLRDALGDSLQGNQVEFAEQLARYLDYTIREGETDKVVFSGAVQANPRTSTGVASTADGVLQDIGRIYSLFPAKDAFEAFYWRDLSRRLLSHQHTLRMDIEEFFIQCLKETSGADVYKFEGMLSDIRSSEELNERYKGWVAMGPSLAWPLRMNIENEDEEQNPTTSSPPSTRCHPVAEHTTAPDTVPHAEDEEEEGEENDAYARSLLSQTEVRWYVLTNGFWPQQPPLSLRLPRPFRVLSRCADVFYRHCFADRRLVWHHELSTAVLRCSLGGARRQLTGTLLQCALLLALEAMAAGPQPRVTVGGLCERAGTAHAQPETAAALLGLCHARLRLVLHSGAGGDGGAALAAEDELRLNENFTAASTRCRIPFVGARRRGSADATGMEKDEKEVQRMAERLMAERTHVMDAAVVRFMKEKRHVTHDELVAAMPTLVRFTVSTAELKKVIERLIERGFLGRDGPTAYVYVS